MKTCSRCRKEKQASEMSKDKRQTDGIGCSCLSCERDRSNFRYANDPRVRERMKSYGDSAKGKEKRRERQKTQSYKDTINEKARDRRSTPEGRRKEVARRSINYALHSGTIFKDDKCSKCGCEKKIEFHHTDLSYKQENDLIGIWLCRLCHVAEHKRLKLISLHD